MTSPGGRPLWIARRLIVLVYGVVMAIILIKVGEPESLWWWLAAIPFLLWIVAPIAVPLLRGADWPATLALGALGGASLFLYWQGLFGPGTSSTEALIFVVLPVYQWGAVGIGAGILSLLRRWWAR